MACISSYYSISSSAGNTVSFKFKYASFLALSGHFLRFEQPERLRLFRHLELILLGRLIRLVQHLKSKSLSLSRCCIDKGTLTKLLQNWRFNLSRFLAFERSGRKVMRSQLLRLTSFKLPRFWSKMKSTERNYTCIPL